MIALIVLITMVALGLGYLFYGKFLVGRLSIDDSRITPACEINDGMDFVPAKAPLLLGQHFSAIAAAGPIVGPILAGIWFGWLPALLWIIIGSIFIGGVHDITSLVVSIRHKAGSVGEIVRQYMSRTSYILFLIFVWLTLVYVIIAFTDITSQTFKAVSEGTVFGPGVAITSFLYLMIGVFLGIALHKFKVNLWVATAVCLPLMLFVVWAGPRFPKPIIDAISGISIKQWDIILLAYCFIASVVPMWILLQPRGYLGGWFLYLTILASLAGLLFGGLRIEYPALNIEGMKSILNGKPLIPILFITVACGACSGFHSVVSSGTTSKQLSKESDARVVGYGAMLLEALVAVLALGSVMILAKGDAALKSDPNIIYAKAIARYFRMVGINFNVAFAFALLAFSTFVYDTLDVCTRLARYILQELLGLKKMSGAFLATLITLLLPVTVLMLTKEKGYMVAWPIFGASNQLLAALALLAVSVWLVKTGRNALFAIIPMIFMIIVTLWSLVLQILPLVKYLVLRIEGATIMSDTVITGVFGIILLILSITLILEAAVVLWLKRPDKATA